MLVGAWGWGGVSLPLSILKKSKNRQVVYFVHKTTEKCS